MKEHLQRSIKEVISEYPAVGDLLNDCGIGCVSCAAGSCLLKDVLMVHHLPKEQEVVLMKRVEQVIYPEREIEIPDFISTEDNRAKKDGLKYSPPLKRLVEEHDRIKSFLALIPEVCQRVKTGMGIDKPLVLGCIDFIRTYADKYHHAKEEDILFTYVDQNSEMIKVMFEEHKTARNLVKSILDDLEKRDAEGVVLHLNSYRELLTGTSKRRMRSYTPGLIES